MGHKSKLKAFRFHLVQLVKHTKGSNLLDDFSMDALSNELNCEA